MKQSDVKDAVRETLMPMFNLNRDRLDRIDGWYRWDHEEIQLPPTATEELKYLRDLSKTPWLNLVVTATAQALFVDGYRSPDSSTDLPQWKTWQANKMNARQTAIHRGALAYGVSYCTVLPGNPADGPYAAMRGVSPRKMVSLYADPAEDDWPMLAMRVEKQPNGKLMLRVYDEENVHFLEGEQHSDRLVYIEPRRHGLGVVPVVRYTNMLDLDGRSAGEVEPFIPLAARINKTDYDRMLAQHFSSWTVRTVAGMAKPADDDEAKKARLSLRQNDLLVAEDPDTKFGTLPGSPLDGFIAAKKNDVQTLASVSQTPTSTLTGDMINLGADALAEARAGHRMKVMERQVSFGESHAQALRLAASVEGNATAAADILANATWQDTSVQSMAQAVDALGKAAQMLMVPPQELWERIPGVTRDDVDRWKAAAVSTDALALFVQRAEASATATQQQAATPPAG